MAMRYGLMHPDVEQGPKTELDLQLERNYGKVRPHSLKVAVRRSTGRTEPRPVNNDSKAARIRAASWPEVTPVAQARDLSSQPRTASDTPALPFHQPPADARRPVATPVIRHLAASTPANGQPPVSPAVPRQPVFSPPAPRQPAASPAVSPPPRQTSWRRGNGQPKVFSA